MTTKYNASNKLLSFKKFVDVGRRLIATARPGARVNYSRVDKSTDMFLYHVGNLAYDREDKDNSNMSTINDLAKYALDQYENGAIELIQKKTEAAVGTEASATTGWQYFAVRRQFLGPKIK